MRFVLVFIVILVLAYVGYETAKRQGWLDQYLPMLEQAIEPDEPEEQEPEVVEEVPGPILPTFDIVRVERTGFVVVAGNGEAGATIEVLANGEVIATDTISEGSSSLR